MKPILLYINISRILLPLGICLIVTQAFGQLSNVQKLDIIPSPKRERLIERLNLYIEYDRTSQFDKLYDLFPHNEFIHLHLGERDEYVKNYQVGEATGQREKVISYKISVVKTDKVDSDDSVSFRGIAKVRRGKKFTEEERLISAVYLNGDWYFTWWQIESEGPPIQGWPKPNASKNKHSQARSPRSH